jgi:hypothetical protein
MRGVIFNGGQILESDKDLDRETGRYLIIVVRKTNCLLRRVQAYNTVNYVKERLELMHLLLWGDRVLCSLFVDFRYIPRFACSFRDWGARDAPRRKVGKWVEI